MPLAFTDFLWVVFSGKRPQPERHVRIISGFVKESNFPHVQWNVAVGDYPRYKDANACFVRETGSSADSVNAAIALANRRKKPVVIMADDVSGIYALDCKADSWRNTNGIYTTALSAANRVLSSMRSVGAKVGGVSPHMYQYMCLQQPVHSLTAFVVADFFVVDPPMVVEWTSECWPKEDYQFSADVMCRYGMLLRENKLCVAAEHHRAGGDGSGPERILADREAAMVLQTLYAGVFKKGKRAEQLSLVNGTKITVLVDEKVTACVERLQAALASTRMSAADARLFVKKVSGRVMQAKQCMLHSSSGRLATRQNVRRMRGTMVTGHKRVAGRRRLCVEKLSKSQRNRKTECRAAVREAAQRVARRRIDGKAIRLLLH